MAHGSSRGIPLDTDGSLATNSDQLVATQKATKAYVDNAAATVNATIGGLFDFASATGPTAGPDRSSVGTTATNLSSTSLTYTNTSGRTKTVRVSAMCTVSGNGTHASYFRLNATGTGVNVVKQGWVRTPVANFVPATLELLLTVTTGNTATVTIQCESTSGGTAYLCETTDGTWSMYLEALG